MDMEYDRDTIEIYASHQLQQLILLGKIQCVPDISTTTADTISLNGTPLSSIDNFELFYLDQYVINLKQVSCNNFFPGYSIVYPGDKLPHGIKYENITLSVIDHGNPLNISWRNVFYLKKYLISPSHAEANPDDNSFEYITALCTEYGELIPHPSAILNYTVRPRSTLYTIPVSNMKEMRSVSHNNEPSYRIRMQYCDSRFYTSMYRRLVQREVMRDDLLLQQIAALDVEQKKERKAWYIMAHLASCNPQGKKECDDGQEKDMPLLCYGQDEDMQLDMQVDMQLVSRANSAECSSVYSHGTSQDSNAIGRLDCFDGRSYENLEYLSKSFVVQVHNKESHSDESSKRLAYAANSNGDIENRWTTSVDQISMDVEFLDSIRSISPSLNRLATVSNIDFCGEM